MASNKNTLLDDFEMQFVYKFTDKFDNELFVFKVNKDNDLKRIKKEIINFICFYKSHLLL